MKKKVIIVYLFIYLLYQTIFIQPTAASTVLENVISDQIGTTNISVSVRSMDNGQVVYEKNGDFGVKPASTIKLITAASALHVLGEDYRFTTRVYIDGQINNGILEGNLYIQGEGDPTLLEGNFLTLVNALKRRGIQSISGNLYGDDTAFIGPQLTPGITANQESYYYAARTSALTMSPDQDYDSGTIIIKVIPNKVGKQPTIEVIPNLSGMLVTNNSITVSKNEKITVDAVRRYKTNQIVVSGDIPIGEPKNIWVTVQDPTINTLHALKNTLIENGINFSNNTVVERKTVPSNADKIYEKKSIPLQNIIVPFLKLSNNGIADILVRTMGKEVYGYGSLEHGLQVIKDYGKDIGLNMNQWNFEDGSGMSHKNTVSANELTKLLYITKSQHYYNTFYNGLPIGGISEKLIGGSLKNRFTSADLKNRVIAKTGHISGVYNLAGYVQAKSGKMYAFAVMTQHQSSVKLYGIDQVVATLIKQF